MWWWLTPLLACLLIGPFLLLDILNGVYGPLCKEPENGDMEQLEERFNQQRKARPKMTDEQIETARAEMDELDQFEQDFQANENGDVF